MDEERGHAKLSRCLWLVGAVIMLSGLLFGEIQAGFADDFAETA